MSPTEPIEMPAAEPHQPESAARDGGSAAVEEPIAQPNRVSVSRRTVLIAVVSALAIALGVTVAVFTAGAGRQSGALGSGAARADIGGAQHAQVKARGAKSTSVGTQPVPDQPGPPRIGDRCDNTPRNGGNRRACWSLPADFGHNVHLSVQAYLYKSVTSGYRIINNKGKMISDDSFTSGQVVNEILHPGDTLYLEPVLSFLVVVAVDGNFVELPAPAVDSGCTSSIAFRPPAVDCWATPDTAVAFSVKALNADVNYTIQNTDYFSSSGTVKVGGPDVPLSMRPGDTLSITNTADGGALVAVAVQPDNQAGPVPVAGKQCRLSSTANPLLPAFSECWSLPAGHKDVAFSVQADGNDASGSAEYEIHNDDGITAFGTVQYGGSHQKALSMRPGDHLLLKRPNGVNGINNLGWDQLEVVTVAP